MAAVISNQGGYYATFAYVSECRRMGLNVLLPDVNASAIPWTGRNRDVRVGLMQLQGMKAASREAIVETRRDGPYRSLEEFLSRVPIDPADVRLLIRAGAFDSIAGGRTRPELMWRWAAWSSGREEAPRGSAQAGLRSVARAARTGRNPSFGGPRAGTAPSSTAGGIPRSGSLFPVAPGSAASGVAVSGGTVAEEPGEIVKPPEGIGDYDPRKVLSDEIETLGFLVSRHPLALYRDVIIRLRNVVPGRDLRQHAGREITMIGWLVTGKIVDTKDDEPMEFVSFEDTTALYETTFFPEAYRRFCHMLSYSRPYLLRGKVEEDFGSVSLTVKELRFLR
jgi:DNA polymerase III alpha subunit